MAIWFSGRLHWICNRTFRVCFPIDAGHKSLYMKIGQDDVYPPVDLLLPVGRVGIAVLVRIQFRKTCTVYQLLYTV